jgi:hypothetical protein
MRTLAYILFCLFSLDAMAIDTCSVVLKKVVYELDSENRFRKKENYYFGNPSMEKYPERCGMDLSGQRYLLFLHSNGTDVVVATVWNGSDVLLLYGPFRSGEHN